MQRKILTGLMYVAVTVLVVVGTFALVAYGTGYSYDFKDHRIVYNGLLMVSSAPSGAEVYIDGRDIKKKTPYRAVLQTGSYTFKLTRDGYHPWQKVLDSVASEVTQAQYVFLFPDTLKLAKVTGEVTGSMLATSVDQQHLAYLVGGANPGVLVVNTGSSQTTRVYTAKPATPTQPAEQVLSATWSADNSHLLIKTTIGGQIYFYLVSASGSGAPTNITSQLGFNFTDLQMSPTAWNQLYWISPQGLRKIDVNAQTVSGVIADNVSSFTLGDGRVFYTQTSPLGESLWAVDSSGHKQEIIQSIAVSPSYDLDFSQYQGEDLLAVLPSATHTVTLYEDVLNPNQTTTVVSDDADQMAFSLNGRFLTYSSGNSMGTYDIQATQLGATGKPVIYAFTSGGNQLEAFNWFDNYHLLMNVDGRLVVMDYDGTNRVSLVNAVPGSIGYETNNDQELWYLRASSTPGVAQVEAARLVQ